MLRMWALMCSNPQKVILPSLGCIEGFPHRIQAMTLTPKKRHETSITVLVNVRIISNPCSVWKHSICLFICHHVTLDSDDKKNAEATICME